MILVVKGFLATGGAYKKGLRYASLDMCYEHWREGGDHVLLQVVELLYMWPTRSQSSAAEYSIPVRVYFWLL